MALSFDTANLVIESTASITDLPAFHAALRDWEDSAGGAIYPVTHTWKALDLGGGAFFYQADLVNGWQLKFPNAGNYAIQGNLNATIIPVAGVYVERKTSAAYATTAIGGSGPSAADIAAAVGARTVEGALSQDATLRILLAALSGRSEGLGTALEKYKSLDGSKDRITVSFDASSNRVTVVLDGTA